MCVWLPGWPLQRIRAAQPEHEQRPLILFSDDGRDGLRVTACSHNAAESGVSPGMRLAEAEGLCSSSRSRQRPRFVRHDPDADRAGLHELAAWCHEFSPLVGVEGVDSLMLDVTGCTHLFGGESGLVVRVKRGITQRSLRAVMALAGTVGAAWAFAHYAPRTSNGVVPTEQQAERLAALPVAALRLPEQALTTLGALGLARIEQLLALPRHSLPSRVGPEVLQRLDQALGDAPELIVPVRPVSPVTAAISLPAPTAEYESLRCVLASLIDRIMARLTEQHEGVQQLEIRLDCGPDAVTTFPAGTVRPTACPNHLAELVLTRLEQTVLPGEVHAVRLTVLHSAPLETRQPQLFEEQHATAHRWELARLVDRLSNRLGKERVVRPRIQPDILPEFVRRWQPLLDCESLVPEPADGSVASRPRPLRLLPEPRSVSVMAVASEGPPVQFDYQNRTHRVCHAWGPERLSGGWWRGRHAQRDYYRVETDKGQRFWLFRRLREGDWYLHGEFD